MAKRVSGGRHLWGRRRGARRARKLKNVIEVVNCLRRLFKAVHEYSKAIQRRAGLSSPQLWALDVLRSNPGLSLGELAERMFAHPSTVSGVLDRLEIRGAVRRLVDQRDRRSIRLFLTARGQGLVRKSPSPIQKSLRAALEGMSAPRLVELRRSLEEISKKTEAQRLRAPFFDLEA